MSAATTTSGGAMASTGDDGRELRATLVDGTQALFGLVSGEPEGWHRHPSSGRRREGGDASREVVAP